MGNFLVYKSSAGSGKTYTLMIEYLTLALKYPTAYKHILAITFTNKAANEIKQRILGNLQKLAFLTPDTIPAKDHELVERLSDGTGLATEQIIENAEKVLSSILHNYSDFAVSTIDSFMHRVIRSFAFDLKLSMNFEIELDTNSLLNAAVDELLSKVGKDDELTLMLKDYVIRKAEDDENWDITNELRESAKALFKEKMAGLIPALESKSFTSLDHNRICEAVKALNKAYKDEGLQALKLIAEAGFDPCDFAYGIKGVGNFFLKVAAGKDADPKGANVRKAVEEGRWFSKGSPLFANVAPIESSLIATVRNITRIRNERRFLTLIMENFYSTLLLKKINTELQNIREQRNLITISDFTSIIAAVVKDQPVPFIYLRVGEKFRNFMIDEFQDTSEMQWENLLPLIENALSDARLSMLVGDGKQAIYRFKNGDAEQFVNLPKLKERENDLLSMQRQQLLAVEYDEKHLVTNYRSRKEIVDFNNSFFRFAADRFVPGHIKFYADVEQKCREDNTGGLVNFDFVDEQDVVKKVLELVEENKNAGYEYGDIAILTRKNKEAVQIAEALQDAGISVVSSESLLLCSSPQVNFLVNWIAFMSNPEDRVSVQGIIEYLFANYDFSRSNLLPRRVDTRYLYEVISYLGINIHKWTFNSLSFYDSVELLVREFGLGVVNPLYTRFFLDKVLEFTRKESSGAAGFIQYWNDNAHKLSVSISQKKEAVQILTVHKSKGLDFPVVIYAFPDPRLNKGDLSWQNISVKLPGKESEDEDFEMPLVFNYLDGLEDTPLEAELKEEEDKVSLDRFNLYYVAFTRASERLYVVMPESSKIEDPPKKLSDLVKVFLNQRNEGNRFGTGERVMGHYNGRVLEDLNQIDSINISFKPGEWREKIILSKRAPEEWPVIRSAFDGEAIVQMPDKTDYGKLVHKILSRVDTLDEVESAVTHILETEKIDSTELRTLIITSLNRLKLLPEADLIFGNRGHLKDLQQKNHAKYIIAEQEILTPGGESYRPDRVVLHPDKTLVIDFKTGLPKPKYITQVRSYMNLISEMGYPNPQGFILYIGNEPEIISLSNSKDLALE